MKNKIKVAFIGAGYMAKEHIKAFADIPGVELAGIYSRTSDRAQLLAKEFNIPKVSGTIDELYVDTEADLVIVSVSILSTAEACYNTFKHPWQCLIEKPAGYNVTEAEQIAKAAKGYCRKAFVALNRRHYSSTRSAIHELDSVQGCRLVNIYDQEDLTAAKGANHPKAVLRNWMYANSIHVIDYLNIFCRGEVLTVDPIIKWNSKDPAFVAAKITFSSGDIGIYQAVWNGPGPWSVVVTTQEKRCELKPLEQAFVQYNGSRIQNPLELAEWDKNFKSGLRRQAEEAVKAIRGEDHNLPTLEDALKTMKLVEDIYG
jgi:predicted dehydrogenase